MKRIILATCMILCGSGCGQDGSDIPVTEPASPHGDAGGNAARAATAAEAAAAMDAMLAEVETSLQRLPGLIGSIQVDMRRHLNSAHVAAAQRKGVGPVRDSAHVEALVRAGRLVQLPDSTTWWVTRELDYSLPYVTPGTRAALEEVGRRFHSRLEARGLPPIRFDITSVLRTGELQERLRRSNRNASRTTSSHEFGTTVDIAYTRFLAPAEVPLPHPALDRTQVAEALDSLATQYANHVEGELGAVLQELLREGTLLPLRERGQAVFHITVARALTD
jgi:hypothetical protein